MTISSMDRETPGIKGEEVSTDERPDRVGDVDLKWTTETIAWMYRDAVKIGHVVFAGGGWKPCPSHIRARATVEDAVECFAARARRAK